MAKITGFSWWHRLLLDGFVKTVRICLSCAPLEGSLAALFGRQEAAST
jgi:hypothetical protein